MSELVPNKRTPFQPGNKFGAAGRPKGRTPLTVEKRLMGKWKVHPVDKLVKLANYLDAKGQYAAAADIWMKLLPYFDTTKKSKKIEPEGPEANEDDESAEETLEMLENGQPTDQSSQSPSLGTGPSPLPPEASAEGDVRQFNPEQ